MKTKHLLSVLASLILAGTSGESARAANVVITALQSTGSPLVGATVSMYSSGWTNVGVTDASGQFTINGISGNYLFSVSFNGTSAATGWINGIPSGSSSYTSVPTFYTTAVTIHGYDEAGNSISGIVNTYLTSGWSSFGTTNGSGIVTKELFPGTTDFKSTYNYTSNTQSITVDGDGFTSGKSTTISTYLSRVNFKATSYMSANVQGVGIGFNSGGWRTLPNTDVNGESSYLMYPGSYNSFVAGINGTSSSTFTVTVPGNGTQSNQSVTVPLNPSRVKFNNVGTVSYYSVSWRNISGSSYYMFPGTYTLHFGAYSRDVVISGLNFDVVASILMLKDHLSDPLSIDAARGGSPTISYHVTNAVSNETPSVWIDVANYTGNNNRIFEVQKNGSLDSLTQDVTVNNVFQFQTYLMTLKLQNCSGTGISGGHVRYGYGSTISSFWSPYTDNNGFTTREFFPGNFVIEMGINQSVETHNVTLTGNDTFTWTTSLVKLHYPGSIAYGGTGVAAYFSNTKEAEMLSGPVKFSFRDHGENIVTLNIPSYTSGCTYELTPVIGRVLNSSSQPLVGGKFHYYLNGWQTAPDSTGTNGNVVALLPGNQSTATVGMTYASGYEQRNNLNLASVGNVVEFQTVVATITLDDTAGNPLVGSVSYYANGTWWPFASGSTTGGTASMELLGGYTYSFAVLINGTRQQMSNVNIISSPVMAFHTKKVRIHYLDNSCNPVQNASASYYAGTWRSMGSTDAAGYSSSVDMLPTGNYSFVVGSAPQQNGIVITTDPLQTVDFTNCSVVLPVHLLSFEGKADDCYAKLSWEVAAGQADLSAFTVQYSKDGIRFESIGHLERNPNSDQYYFSYTQAPGKGFYRLLIAENSGAMEYSKTVAITTDCASSPISIAPNPTRDLAVINGVSVGDQITITNVLGNVIARYTAAGSSVVVDLSHQPSELYSVIISRNGEMLRGAKLSKQ